MVRRFLFPVLAALVLAAPATAQRFPGSQWAPETQERAPERDREVPLSSILRELRMQYGGQHLDAQRMGNRYRISWITEDGRRLTIEVDAETGRTISVRG